jgi:hypothetical protein
MMISPLQERDEGFYCEKISDKVFGGQVRTYDDLRRMNAISNKKRKKIVHGPLAQKNGRKWPFLPQSDNSLPPQKLTADIQHQGNC